MSTALEKRPCEKCGSSDGLQVFQKEDGRLDGYCFACDTHYKTIDGEGASMPKKTVRASSTQTVDDITKLPSADLTDRKIRKEVLDVYGVKLGISTITGDIEKHYYPVHSHQGELTGFKQRIVATKDFLKVGETKGGVLFGQNICPSNRKVFVTEGEIDALALYQVLLDGMPKKSRERGYTPSVVGVTTGAQGGAKQLMDNIDFLKKFKEVIIVFDQDDVGKKGAEKIAKSLELGDDKKVLIASFPEKDAGKMLEEGKEKELYSACLFDAQPYEPDGIVNAATAWDRYKDRKSAECHPYPDAFSGLNDQIYGWRFGSVVTVTSGSGMGKTQFIREVMYDVLQKTDEKIAYIALEEDIGDTMEGLMGLHLNKRINLPDVEVTEEEERRAFDELFGDGRVELYDHFGGMDDADLFSRIRYFATYLGCRVFALDHLSIVISETADEGDERRRIDAVMTKLAKIVKELNVVIFLVVHLRKAAQGKSFEEGHVPTSDDLRGSGSIKQLSWDVIALSRNQQEEDEIKRNTTGIHVLKSRFCGSTGKAGFTYYDGITGRMRVGTDPDLADDFDEVF